MKVGHGLWRYTLLALCLASSAGAHDVISTKLTWTIEMARLVQRHCLECHGENASIPLTTYEEARPWAKAIRDRVMRRQMPPWGAVAGFGPRLRDDPGLTQSEIETVVRWVEGGAPKGDEIWLPRMSAQAALPVPALREPFVIVGCDWQVPVTSELIGLRPEGIGPGNEMRLILHRPDGQVLPVIWIREYPKNGRDFLFVRPLAMPKGSVLQLETDVESDAALSIRAKGASLQLPETEIRKQIRHCPAP